MKFHEDEVRRVLLICTNANESGAPRHVEQIARGLSRKCNFVIVFGREGAVSERLRASGFKVYIIKSINNRPSFLEFIYGIVALYNLAKKYKPEFIHCHSFSASIFGRLIATFIRKPWLYTVHGWGWRGFGPFTEFAVKLIEIAFSKLPKGNYIYVSNSVKIEGIRGVKLHHKRGDVVYNGAENSDFKGSIRIIDRHIRILSLARVDAAKDYRTLIAAFERANAGDLELILFGEGTNEPSFIEWAKLLAPNYWRQIKFGGEICNPIEQLLLCQIVILVSNFEALPMSLIEGAATAKPLIATRVGGVPEIIDHGVNGILVGKGRIEEVVQAINLLRNEKLRERFGRAARKKYDQRFKLTSMLESVSKIYTNIS